MHNAACNGTAPKRTDGNGGTPAPEGYKFKLSMCRDESGKYSSPDLNDRSRPAFPIWPPVHVARAGFAAEKAGPTGLRRRGHEGGQGLRRACLGCAAFLDA